MRAKKLFSITDVEGVRMNPDDPKSVISEFRPPTRPAGGGGRHQGGIIQSGSMRLPWCEAVWRKPTS